MVKDGHLIGHGAGQVHGAPQAARTRGPAPSWAVRSAIWSTWPRVRHQQHRHHRGAASAGRLRDPHDLRQEEGRRAREGRQEGPQGEPQREAAPEDGHVRPVRRGLRGPEDGAIVAIYGGEDATKHFTNNADDDRCRGRFDVQAVRAGGGHAGRHARPRARGVAGAGRTHQVVSPDSLYSGKNELKIKTYDGDDLEERQGQGVAPDNDDERRTAAPPNYRIDLREAMRESVNSAFVQLGMDVGLDKVKKAAENAGLKAEQPDGHQLPVLLHRYLRPQRDPHGRCVRHLRDQRRAERAVLGQGGQVRRTASVFKHKAEPKEAFDRAGRRQRHRRPEDRRRGRHRYHAQLDGREVAGKTGTTDGNKSAWFVGYTPQLSTAISMYRMDDDETKKSRQFLEMYGTGGQKTIHGASFPAEIWHDYMEQALKGEKAENFPRPSPSARSSTTLPTPSPTPTPSESEEEPLRRPVRRAQRDADLSPRPPRARPVPLRTSVRGHRRNRHGRDRQRRHGRRSRPPHPRNPTSHGNSRGNDNGGGIFGGPTG